MEEGHFRTPGLRNPELIQLKSGMFDYIRRSTPHVK